MAARHTLIVAAASIAVLSCSSAPAKPSPTPNPAPSGGAAQQPGGPVVTLGARRPPPSRDSLEKLRAIYVAQIMGQIAGHENDPADQVFKNVQVLKGITAAQLVQKMDKEYATAMSWNCTNCHRFAARGDFANDTSADKRRARFLSVEVSLAKLPCGANR